MKYQLPTLSYNYDALEPYIDKKTMEIHYTKHHQTYVNNTNLALKNNKFINYTIEELLKNLNDIPHDKRNFLRNNAGGHFNHSIFWKILKKNTILNGNLKKAIEKNFKNFSLFKENFETAALTHFGSGWTWLVKKNNKLNIVCTNNQDNPLMGDNICGVNGFPIFGIDLWEHAYYLKYQNQRFEYIKAFWNVINWDEAELRFKL